MEGRTDTIDIYFMCCIEELHNKALSFIREEGAKYAAGLD
jgi:hypothetical protein